MKINKLQPWNLINDINKWLNLFTQQLEQLGIDFKKYEQMRQSVERKIKKQQTDKYKAD